MRFSFLLIFTLMTAVVGRSAESQSTADFSKVAKILAEHCLDCHSVDDPDGKLVLENYDLLMKGGESGPAIVPGKSAESLLVKMVEGKFEKDGKTKFMPPGKREKLKAEEIGTIRGWIDAGALAPTENVVVSKEIVVPKITPKVQPRRSIHSIAFSSQAKLLAVGRSGEVELHSAEGQALVRTLSGPAGHVNGVVFSADGKTLYAAGGDVGIQGEIKAWNVEDGNLLRTISGHKDAIYGLALSPDGKVLATGSYDQKVKLWNTETGGEIRTLSGHNGCVYSIAFRPDGKILATASGDRTVKLWEVATGDRRDTLSQPLKEQYTVAFSPDGALLAAAGVDNRIRVWSISAEATETTNPLLQSKFAHEGAILKLAFSSDGKSIVSSAEDKTVKLWEVMEMKERRSLETQPDWASALAFILENKGLAVGRLDGSLAYYDSQTGGKLAPPKPELAAVEPRGIQRGVPVRAKLVGKNLQTTSAVKFNNDEISATIVKEPAASPTEVWIDLAAKASLARGTYEVRAVTANGETAPAKLHVDDLPQYIETESHDAQKVPSLPATLWGSHLVSGDSDLYTFEAKAGELYVFDAAAKAISSKASLVLRLRDLNGKVLASNNGFDQTGDPLLTHRFEEAGEYQLEVDELVVAGSAEHFYRVSVGAFGFVTGAYPPIVRAGEGGHVDLIGYNLSAKEITQPLKAEGLEHSLKLDPEKLRWRGETKLKVTDKGLALESEPNNDHSTANNVAAPGIAAGRFSDGDKEDWFRFETKVGQEWIIETAASGIGSPADTRIEIRDSQGRAVLRTLLQAVRDSAVTFRGIDSTTSDCRVENWEEMELNQYLYLQGEVVRLFRAPQGPDSGFLFYTVNGRRRNYFDTTASAHANAEPCYIVEAHPPGAKLALNGLPVFEVFYENDDDADRKLGSDSRVSFRAPADGAYFVRVTDTRGFSGDRFLYTVTFREAQPDFKISVEGMNPSVGKGSGQRFAVNAERLDGFDGEIRVEVSGLPSGFTVSNPIIIQAGHTTAFGTLNVFDAAMKPSDEQASAAKLVATAEINGKTITRDAGTLGKISLADSAPLYVALEPSSAASPEITIAPGGTVPAWLRIRRNGHTDLVTFQVENLPHGMIVDNIGLNGVLIPKDQNEREIFLTAAKWVPETERLCYAVANEAGRQTSLPVLIKVRRSTQVTANQ